MKGRTGNVLAAAVYRDGRGTVVSAWRHAPHHPEPRGSSGPPRRRLSLQPTGAQNSATRRQGHRHRARRHAANRGR